MDNITYKDCNDWMDRNCGQAALFASKLPRMRPDLGFTILVDGMEVPEKLFPDEYAKIREAYLSVHAKMEKHFKKLSKS